MADTGRVLQPFWLPIPGDYDEPFIEIPPFNVVFVDGFAIPGVSNVEVSKAHSLSVKQSAGRHFATVTDQGYKPCDVIITTQIWTPKQWEIWQLNILPLLEPDPGGKYALPTVNISNPVTYARRIDAITVEAITGPTDKGKGIREFKIKAINFAKQSKATNTPKQAGISPFSNALTGKGNKPSSQEIPEHG